MGCDSAYMVGLFTASLSAHNHVVCDLLQHLQDLLQKRCEPIFLLLILITSHSGLPWLMAQGTETADCLVVSAFISLV